MRSDGEADSSAGNEDELLTWILEYSRGTQLHIFGKYIIFIYNIIYINIYNIYVIFIYVILYINIYVIFNQTICNLSVANVLTFKDSR